MLGVESTWGELYPYIKSHFKTELCLGSLTMRLFCCNNVLISFENPLNSSELAQRVGIDEIAESMMAFNTNYKDTGLFGVYAIAKVRLLPISVIFCYDLNKI